jgi:hypothetical protein
MALRALDVYNCCLRIDDKASYNMPAPICTAPTRIGLLGIAFLIGAAHGACTTAPEPRATNDHRL